MFEPPWRVQRAEDKPIATTTWENNGIIVALWLINDAMNGYKAARHAQKAVYNRDLSFIDYMVMNHPIMTICIAILLLLAVIAIFI